MSHFAWSITVAARRPHGQRLLTHQMNPAARISVVMPTYNCAPLMARHLESVVKWADLADEIVVVDSRSTDGTLNIIRKHLRHPNIRIIERDRGLYESWNEGIAATSGDWIYISTAGDTIEREHLLHLKDLGERSHADVVISAPDFVDETGIQTKGPAWPPAEVIAGSGQGRPFTLTTEAGFVLTFIHCPSAILGSSASNLYRGDHLRARPFPSEFKGAGDSVWILRHAAQSSLCFTPQVGSTFCLHPKEEETNGDKLVELSARILVEKEAAIARPGIDGMLVRALAEESRLTAEVQAVHQERRRLWRSRPLTASLLGSWARLTIEHFRSRAKLKKLRRRIRGKFLARSCYQAVSL